MRRRRWGVAMLVVAGLLLFTLAQLYIPWRPAPAPLGGTASGGGLETVKYVDKGAYPNLFGIFSLSQTWYLNYGGRPPVPADDGTTDAYLTVEDWVYPVPAWGYVYWRDHGSVRNPSRSVDAIDPGKFGPITTAVTADGVSGDLRGIECTDAARADCEVWLLWQPGRWGPRFFRLQAWFSDETLTRDEAMTLFNSVLEV